MPYCSAVSHEISWIPEYHPVLETKTGRERDIACYYPARVSGDTTKNSLQIGAEYAAHGDKIHIEPNTFSVTTKYTVGCITLSWKTLIKCYIVPPYRTKFLEFLNITPFWRPKRGAGGILPAIIPFAFRAIRHKIVCKSVPSMLFMATKYTVN